MPHDHTTPAPPHQPIKLYDRITLSRKIMPVITRMPVACQHISLYDRITLVTD